MAIRGMTFPPVLLSKSPEVLDNYNVESVLVCTKFSHDNTAHDEEGCEELKAGDISPQQTGPLQVPDSDVAEASSQMP